MRPIGVIALLALTACDGGSVYTGPGRVDIAGTYGVLFTYVDSSSADPDNDLGSFNGDITIGTPAADGSFAGFYNFHVLGQSTDTTGLLAGTASRDTLTFTTLGTAAGVLFAGDPFIVNRFPTCNWAQSIDRKLTGTVTFVAAAATRQLTLHGQIVLQCPVTPPTIGHLIRFSAQGLIVPGIA